MEKSYLWTDENTLNEVLLDAPKNSFNTEFLRKILKEYFNCIKNIINHLGRCSFNVNSFVFYGIGFSKWSFTRICKITMAF